MLRTLALLLLVFAIGCAPGEGEPANSDGPDGNGPAGESSEKGPTNWGDEYEEMAATLKLTDQEQADLKAAFEAGAKTYSDWKARHGEQLAEADREMKRAVKLRDLRGMQTAKAKGIPLRKQVRKIIADRRKNILLALSPENRVKWQAHKVTERLLELMEPLQLNGQQIAAVREKAADAVRQSAGSSNPKAAAYVKLEKDVESTVLNAAQRAEFQAIKKKNPFRTLR